MSGALIIASPEAQEALVGGPVTVWRVALMGYEGMDEADVTITSREDKVPAACFSVLKSIC